MGNAVKELKAALEKLKLAPGGLGEEEVSSVCGYTAAWELKAALENLKLAPGGRGRRS
jgi:hypothetical protein